MDCRDFIFDDDPVDDVLHPLTGEPLPTDDGSAIEEEEVQHGNANYPEC